MTKTIKALALGTALVLLPGASLTAFAHSPSAKYQDDHDRDHHDHDRDADRNRADYSHNRYYQLGNREGYEDYGKKERRKEHNHQFHRDDDRRAHDAGYENGWQGHQYTEGNRPH